MLFGQVRVYGTPSVLCSGNPNSGYGLDWSGATSLILASGFPLSISGSGISVTEFLGYTNLFPAQPGVHVATITLPFWARPLPLLVAPPAYDESPR